MKREGVNYPKFADKFAVMDFEADPLPVLSLYPVPPQTTLHELGIEICGLDQHPRRITWHDLAALPFVSLKAPLVCQIFNWSETVEWGGIRLVDALDHLKIDTHPEGYYALASRDGMYFEALSRDEARDPRVLLATMLNGIPLPNQYGGPLRLVVPFLQGYKSVKWIGAIKAYRHNPVGIKRLLGQSRTGQLSASWKKRFGIEQPVGRAADPAESMVASVRQTPIDAVMRQPNAPAVEATVFSSHLTVVEEHLSRSDSLCEVMAVVRPDKRAATQRALRQIGVVAYSAQPVMGRSRQRGLRFPSAGAQIGNRPAIRFLPKLLFMMVIEKAMVAEVIEALIRANRSGPGHFGDGKIFVLEVADAVRISAAEYDRVTVR
ncbi:MAG: molybdopterin-dependent oxidoreductase [Nitrospirota bacterium]